MTWNNSAEMLFCKNCTTSGGRKDGKTFAQVEPWQLASGFVCYCGSGCKCADSVHIIQVGDADISRYARNCRRRLDMRTFPCDNDRYCYQCHLYHFQQRCYLFQHRQCVRCHFFSMVRKRKIASETKEYSRFSHRYGYCQRYRHRSYTVGTPRRAAESLRKGAYGNCRDVMADTRISAVHPAQYRFEYSGQELIIRHYSPASAYRPEIHP